MQSPLIRGRIVKVIAEFISFLIKNKANVPITQGAKTQLQLGGRKTADKQGEILTFLPIC